MGTALAVACAAGAIAYKPPVIKFGWPPVELNGGFEPAKLPKKKLAPIHLAISGAVETPAGSPSPVLKEVILETDKNGAVLARGLAACPIRMIEAVDTATALRACKPAWVGEGEVEFEVELPEQAPFFAKSRAIAFNGGVHGGKTTVYLFAYLASPVAEAFVVKVKVSKVHRGRYGAKWVAKIPPIAAGSGSVKKFNLKFFRMFTYKGKRHSYLLARCADGKLQARWEAKLSDGSGYDGDIVRPCTPKG